MSLLHILVTGIVATIVGDLWHLFLRVFLGLPTGKWGIVGRWVAGFARGRLVDTNIASRPAVPYEDMLGWAFHYVVGIGYAVLYLIWLTYFRHDDPSFLNGLVFGVVTVLAPFLVMKPALGGGFFGLKAPQPIRGMVLSLLTHAIFGIGLYLGHLVYTL